MGGESDARRTGILRVAKLALERYRARHRAPPVVRELQRAVAEAEREPDSPWAIEAVRSVLVSVPELKTFLEDEFPAGAKPLPFRGRAAVC